MKISIAFKWARDPKDARISSSGNVDVSAARLKSSDDDAAAARVAGVLAGDGEVVGITLGSGDLAWAAARGAAQTVVVTDADANLDAAATAAVLAAGVNHVGGVDVVVVGDGAWDLAVPVCIGSALGIPTVAGVVAAEQNGDRLTVIQRAESGTITLDVPTPCVLAVVAQRAEAAPGMRDVLAARKKPVEKVTTADLGVDAGAARVSVRGIAKPEGGAVRMIDGADASAAATQLVAALRGEGVL